MDWSYGVEELKFLSQINNIFQVEVSNQTFTITVIDQDCTTCATYNFKLPFISNCQGSFEFDGVIWLKKLQDFLNYKEFQDLSNIERMLMVEDSQIIIILKDKTIGCEWVFKYPLHKPTTDGLVIKNMENFYGELKGSAKQLYDLLKLGWERGEVCSCTLQIPTQGELSLTCKNDKKEEILWIKYKNIQTNIYHHAIEINLKKIQPFLNFGISHHYDHPVMIRFHPSRPLEIYIGSNLIGYIAPLEDM